MTAVVVFMRMSGVDMCGVMMVVRGMIMALVRSMSVRVSVMMVRITIVLVVVIMAVMMMAAAGQL